MLEVGFSGGSWLEMSCRAARLEVVWLATYYWGLALLELVERDDGELRAPNFQIPVAGGALGLRC